MARDMLDTTLRKQVFAKYEHRCHVCHYHLKPALRVHHIVPVNLGGQDNIENLVLLCSNCHALTHHFGAKRYAEKDIRPNVVQALGSETATRLAHLAQQMHKARINIENNDGSWTATKNTKAAYDLAEAVSIVAQRNHFLETDEYQLLEIIRLVINYVPASVIPRSSFRLVSSGKYISINVMNYLLFRAPAYSDLGGKPQYDCYLIFPMDAEIPHFITADCIVFEFKDFDCINLGLFSDEILQLTENNWQSFADACEMATHAKRSREWLSNINI